MSAMMESNQFAMVRDYGFCFRRNSRMSEDNATRQIRRQCERVYSNVYTYPGRSITTHQNIHERYDRFVRGYLPASPISRTMQMALNYSRETAVRVKHEFADYGHELGRAIASGNSANIRAMASAILQNDAHYQAPGLMRKLGELGLQVCSRCNAVHENGILRYVQSFGYWCNVCAQHDAVFSDLMGCLIVRGYAQYTNDGDCALPEWFEENHYRRDRRTGEWHDRDNEDYESGQVFSYHDGPDIGRIPSLIFDSMKVPMLTGIEMEIEVGGDSDDENLYEVAGYLARSVKGYAKFETDGSLDNGLEIITGYTGLDTHEERLRGICKAIAECDANIRSATTNTCGLHVHIDRENIDPFHAGKLMAFVHAPEQERLIRCIARRYGGHYCGVSHSKARIGDNYDVRCAKQALKDYKQAKQQGYGWARPVVRTESRYELVNFQNERTLEFRMFKGSVALDTIMASIEFSRMVWFFTKQASIRQLTTPQFIKFISLPENRYETRYLRYYLAKKLFGPRNVTEPYFVDQVFPGTAKYADKVKRIEHAPIFSEQ